MGVWFGARGGAPGTTVISAKAVHMSAGPVVGDPGDNLLQLPRGLPAFGKRCLTP